MSPALWTLLLEAAQAGAPSGPEVVAGFDGNARSGYTFASVTSPSFESKATVVARVSTSYLYYLYPGWASEVHVRSPGLAIGAGVRWRPERVSFTGIAGYEARYTMEFDAEDRMFAHADHGPMLAADVYFQSTDRLALAASGYYGFAQEYLWCRALAKHRLFPWEGSAVVGLSLGLDGTIRGNDTMRGLEVGGLVELAIPAHRLSFGLHLGMGREVQTGAGAELVPSLGVSFYKSF